MVGGDGITEGGEECDDGNATSGDSCDNNCTVSSCGNGILTAGEDCDDGNATNGNGCDNNCTATGCGNGIQTAGEDCDDGNTAGGDGCRADCTVELCGDTIIDPNEECDDGNQDDGDCCSSACLLDPVGTPCDDGQFCTSDSCDNGACASTHYVPSECNDRNFCTDDECDEDLSGGVGACTHTLNTRPCSDGNSCSVNDVCSGGQCVPGEFREPWINEIDYDDQSEGAGTHDNDEFIEIAGPSGMDISNYWLVSVEGGGSGCNTPLFYNVGVVHWTAQIPAGTVLKGGTCVGGDNDGGRCASADDCPGGVCDDPTLIGYYVACFGDTSTDVVHCDGQFDKDWIDSTVHNAHVYNTDDSCPDGVVLADQNFQPGSPTSMQSIASVVDALSYEGVVPNVGAGVLFYAPQLVVGDPGSYLPYNMGTDEGGGYCGGLLGLAVVDAPGVSLEKRSDIAGRAISAGEWFDSGNCDDLAQIGHTDNCILGFCECVADPDCITNSATPGGPNAGEEAMTCVAEAVCGDGNIDPPEDCDTGAPNPDDPCAVGQVCAADCACRVPAICGNGIVEWGETCDIANGNADCGPAELCNADCQCEPLYCGNGQLDPDQGEECDLSAGVDCVPPEICTDCVCNLPPLGSLAFDIADGPGDVCPAPDAMGSWTKTHGGPEGGLAGGAPVCNGTIGGWAGSIQLVGGSPDENGIADLTIDGVNVYGANMNPNACALFSQPPCRLCFRVRQDPLNTGYVDCDGGTSVDVGQIVTSNEANPPPPPDPETAVGGGPDSGSGAAVVFALVKNGMFQADPCPAWNSTVWDAVEEDPVVFTTGTGLSRINDPRVCPGALGTACPNVDPYEVTLTGENFDCGNWITSTSGVLVMPASVLDMTISILGTGDLAQVTRLCRSADCQEPAP